MVFTHLEFSDESSLPPLALRLALSETFKEQQKFQMQNMDDAAECFVSSKDNFCESRCVRYVVSPSRSLCHMS